MHRIFKFKWRKHRNAWEKLLAAPPPPKGELGLLPQISRMWNILWILHSLLIWNLIELTVTFGDVFLPHLDLAREKNAEMSFLWRHQRFPPPKVVREQGTGNCPGELSRRSFRLTHSRGGGFQDGDWGIVDLNATNTKASPHSTSREILTWFQAPKHQLEGARWGIHPTCIFQVQMIPFLFSRNCWFLIHGALRRKAS